MTTENDAAAPGCSASLPLISLLGGVALGVALTFGASKAGLVDLVLDTRAAPGFVHPDPFMALQAGRQFSATSPSSMSTPTTNGDPTGIPAVETMTERLQARLVDAPDDADGWQMLGWTYLNQGSYTKAIAAYRKVVALRPDDAKANASLGEALVRQADGRVTEEAVEIFRRTVELDLDEPRAQFFLGLSKSQSGDPEGAVRDWQALVVSAPPDADWVSDVQARIFELSREASIASDAPSGNVSPGPTADEVAAAVALPDDDRAAMIRGMVGRLQARLDRDPRDAEGWVKLIRSWAVLGETGRAETALRTALETFSDEPATRDVIVAQAAALGVVLR